MVWEDSVIVLVTVIGKILMIKLLRQSICYKVSKIRETVDLETHIIPDFKVVVMNPLCNSKKVSFKHQQQFMRRLQSCDLRRLVQCTGQRLYSTVNSILYMTNVTPKFLSYFTLVQPKSVIRCRFFPTSYTLTTRKLYCVDLQKNSYAVLIR